MLVLDVDFEQVAEDMDTHLDLVVRKVALDLYGRITKKTPVDTGRARANWNLSIGSPDLTVDDDATKIKSASLSKGDGEKDIYIANNLPYISALEHGHSKQAPRGMVALSIKEVNRAFK